jgi:hypothetical protein
VAQKTDATVKLVQAGVVPRQQAWEDLGYTATQQARMADWFAANGTDPQVVGAREDQRARQWCCLTLLWRTTSSSSRSAS